MPCFTRSVETALRHLLIPCFMLALLGACSSLQPQTAKGLYPVKPEARQIRQSSAQAELVRIAGYDSKTIFSATRTVLQNLGYRIDVENIKKGMMAASRQERCAGHYRMALTLAIYVVAVDTSPLSRYTILLDRHDTECFQDGEKLLAEELALEIDKQMLREAD